jgi:hypothetical protein
MSLCGKEEMDGEEWLSRFMHEKMGMQEETPRYKHPIFLHVWIRASLLHFLFVGCAHLFMLCICQQQKHNERNGASVNGAIVTIV